MKSLLRYVTWVLALGPVVGMAAEDFARWQFHRELRLDTSVEGANVAGDVRDFPLAIALNADNFDFDRAKPDGADTRISLEANGAPLPYQIESWVQTNRSALVWVKLPLVRGNRADQKLFLHWGNAAASDASDANAVFDMRAGYVAVWHLADDGGMEEGGYRDATANAAHGTGVNMVRSSRVDARLGRGHYSVMQRTNGFASVARSARSLTLRINSRFPSGPRRAAMATKVTNEHGRCPATKRCLPRATTPGVCKSSAFEAGTSRRRN